MNKRWNVENFYVTCIICSVLAGPFVDFYAWLQRRERHMKKETARKVVVILGAAFALLFIVMWRSEPHAGAKASLTSPGGGWREVAVSNYGPFLTPVVGSDGWTRWQESETLEEFLLLCRECYLLSQGQWKVVQLNCRSPRIERQWEKIGSRKYLLGCKPKDEADPRAYLLIFRSQEEGWALDRLEREK